MQRANQDSKWFYKDPTGSVRGPFLQAQMAAWYDLGYFPDDLEIAFGENSMFLPLKSYKQIGIGALIGGGQSI
jgi:GYF domain